MSNIHSEADLKAAILILEARQAVEEKLLKEEFRQAYERMKPINLIKSTLKKVVASGDVQNGIVNTSVGLAAGYVSNLLFKSVTSSPLRKILGIAIQYGVTSLVAKHPEAVKSMGKGLVNLVKRVATKKEKNENS